MLTTPVTITASGNPYKPIRRYAIERTLGHRENDRDTADRLSRIPRHPPISASFVGCSRSSDDGGLLLLPGGRSRCPNEPGPGLFRSRIMSVMCRPFSECRRGGYARDGSKRTCAGR